MQAAKLRRTELGQRARWPQAGVVLEPVEIGYPNLVKAPSPYSAHADSGLSDCIKAESSTWQCVQSCQNPRHVPTLPDKCVNKGPCGLVYRAHLFRLRAPRAHKSPPPPLLGLRKQSRGSSRADSSGRSLFLPPHLALVLSLGRALAAATRRKRCMATRF